MDKEFAESYNTVEWQKKKNRILERDKYTCQICGNSTRAMQVHHISYKNCRGKAYGALDDELITLCPVCHKHDDGDHVHFYGGLCELKIPSGVEFNLQAMETAAVHLKLDKYEREDMIYAEISPYSTDKEEREKCSNYAYRVLINEIRTSTGSDAGEGYETYSEAAKAALDYIEEHLV